MTDVITKTSILYLAALSANRAQQISSRSEGLDFNASTVHKTPATEIFDYNGRLRIVSQSLPDSKRESTPTPVSKTSNIAIEKRNEKDAVSELFELESKLSSLGLMKSSDLNSPNNPLSHQVKSQAPRHTVDNYSRHLSSTLGDSFLILSTYQSKVSERIALNYSLFA